MGAQGVWLYPGWPFFLDMKNDKRGTIRMLLDTVIVAEGKIERPE